MQLTSHPGLGYLADVRRYDGTQGSHPDSLHHPADGQHPNGSGEHQHGPADQQKPLEQHHASRPAENPGHVSCRKRSRVRTDAEHGAKRLSVFSGDREREQRLVGAEHALGRRRPAEYGTVDYRTQCS